MGNFGGARYSHKSRRELRRRRTQAISCVLLGALAVATAAVVQVALSR